ncbi:MAG: response regulator transcription factor [Cyclobacteriaceae bacterium]|nr:response regulator transcription factor [Cyclobacteriaceae bacterium]
MKDIKYKVVLADDHQIICEGLVSLLKAAPYIEVIGFASNGKEVLDLLKIKPTDMVIMDINMPIMDGIKATEQIKIQFPDVKVLILSMHNQIGYINNAVMAGADGYLMKNAESAEFLTAIDKILHGESYFCLEVANKMVNKIQQSVDFGDFFLSDKEKIILPLLGEGCTTNEIANRINSSKHTVDTYRRNLLHKFNAKNVSELIKIATKEGYIS